MRRVLVTGANRGLGLEFTHQLLARGDRVIAACRDPQHAKALHALARAHADRLHPIAVDMADADSVSMLAHQATQRYDGLDLLINNAGMLVSGEHFGDVTAAALASSVQVNTVGPFLLVQALAPLLRKGDAPTVANLSSRLGSMAITSSFYTPSYAISKAALNMATVLLAHALKADGVRVIALSPGWVKTDMGGAGADVLPAISVSGMLRVMDAMTMQDSGTFMDYQGQSILW